MITINELMASSTAKRLGIDNTPNKELIAKMNLLILNILQPIRNKYGKKISITSGFRCPKLNKAVGGQPTSQHTKGEAADINNGISENRDLFELIKKMIDNKEIVVGQLINEKNYLWIHISLPDKNHNNQILHL